VSSPRTNQKGCHKNFQFNIYLKLISLSRGHLEEPIVAQLAKKFSVFYETLRSVITVQLYHCTRWSVQDVTKEEHYNTLKGDYFTETFNKGAENP
jgi:hypothetical protein